MQVIDEILAYHTLGVCQEVLLSFASHACQLLTPLLHFTYLPLIGKTHEADKEFKEQFVFFVQVNGFQCFDKVTVGKMRQSETIIRAYTVFLLQSVGNICFFYFTDVETLRTAQDCRQYHVRSFGYQ